MAAKSVRPARFLSVTSIAEQLQVSTKTVRRWIARGELHVHRVGRQQRIAEEDFAASLAGCRR